MARNLIPQILGILLIVCDFFSVEVAAHPWGSSDSPGAKCYINEHPDVVSSRLDDADLPR